MSAGAVEKKAQEDKSVCKFASHLNIWDGEEKVEVKATRNPTERLALLDLM